jgi:hypothetical protein
MTEVNQCPSLLRLGEGPLEVRCERDEGHRGKHRECGESADEESGRNVSVTIEWLEEES